MTARVFIVGTGTEIGKTAVTCALLRSAQDHQVRAIPFKPAQSGDDADSDVARLLFAAKLDPAAQDRACPLQYDEPLAPGIADDATAFLRPAAANASPHPAALERVIAALDAWEAEHNPDITFVEGAGGLHVPMPGGTWLPTWIAALATHTVVVGAAGLGTINHTHLTIDALRSAGLDPLGFYLSETTNSDDPSLVHNPQIVALATGCEHFGTLPFGAIERPPKNFIRPLLERL